MTLVELVNRAGEQGVGQEGRLMVLLDEELFEVIDATLDTEGTGFFIMQAQVHEPDPSDGDPDR